MSTEVRSARAIAPPDGASAAFESLIDVTGPADTVILHSVTAGRR